MHIINLHLTVTPQVVKIKGIKVLQQDIDNYPIIRDQIAYLGCLLLHTFGNFFVPVLFATHTVKNLDFRNESDGFEKY